MGKQKNKLVLDKNTIKSVKVKTDLKTGAPPPRTADCDGGGLSNPGQGLSANFSRGISGAY